MSCEIAKSLFVTANLQPQEAIRVVEDPANVCVLSYTYSDGNNPLMLACINKNTDLAIAILRAVRAAGPEVANKVMSHVNPNSGNTPLICACEAEMADVALKIVYIAGRIPAAISAVNRSEISALAMATFHKLTNVAEAIIATGHSNPKIVLSNPEGDTFTPLMIACAFGLTSVAEAIVSTGESYPEYVSEKSKNTALILACSQRMWTTASAILMTKNAAPGQVSASGQTALLIAAKNNQTKIACEIISTGSSNLDYISPTGTSALQEAKAHNNHTLIGLITVLSRGIPMTTMAKCMDFVSGDEIRIVEFVRKNPYNFVIGIERQGGEIEFTCCSLRDLRMQFKSEFHGNGNQLFMSYFECTPDAPAIPQGDYGRYVPTGAREFVKITGPGGGNYLVVKPKWFWSGPVPSPAVFLLRPAGTVQKFVTNQAYPRLAPSFNFVGMEHCNQTSPQTVYALEPYEFPGSKRSRSDSRGGRGRRRSGRGRTRRSRGRSRGRK